MFDELLVRVHLMIVMIRWTVLAPWESEFSFPGNERTCWMRMFLMRALHVKRIDAWHGGIPATRGVDVSKGERERAIERKRK